MTPLEHLIGLIRRSLIEGMVTKAGVEELKQAALHVIDYDTTSAEETRAALRDALDTTNRPNASSFKTDSGIGASRAR
jgi:hypothetical protein